MNQLSSATEGGPKRPYRLAVWITHPIQYHAPFFRKLSEHPEVELTVYYGSDQGLGQRLDPEFKLSIRWDIPLLEGYRSRFLRNYSWKRTPSGFWWVINPGIIPEFVRGKFDAVLLHGYSSPTSWMGYLAAWLAGAPVLFRGESLLREHRTWKRVVKGLVLRSLFRHTAACLAVGRLSRDFYLAYDVPESRIFLTPYSVDNEYFLTQAERWRERQRITRDELDLPHDLPVVLFSGKLIPGKRPMDLIKAASRIRRPVGVLFVGDGPLRATLEAEARRLELPFVRFVGFQNQSALPRFYAVADIFALPSASEAYGLVVNEAMCMGLPVLTTPAVAAAADLVREGDNGYLFAVGDVPTLTVRISQLAADPQLRSRMGMRSREIISGWNYDACVKGIVSALRCVE